MLGYLAARQTAAWTVHWNYLSGIKSRLSIISYCQEGIMPSPGTDWSESGLAFSIR